MLFSIIGKIQLNITDAAQSDFPFYYLEIIAGILFLIIILIIISLFYFGGGEKHSDQPEQKTADLKSFRKIRYLFYSVMFSAVGILSYYYIDEYDLRIAAYKEHMGSILLTTDNFFDETKLVRLSDPASLLKGENIYKANCVACHADDGGGLVGPNLTDNYWIYGGDFKTVFKTIKNGNPSRGMIAWGEQLKTDEIIEVASYVLSLQGKKCANPKAPEGKLFEAASVENVSEIKTQ